jgi:amidase
VRLDEYASLDGLALAALVRAGEVTQAELVALALQAAQALEPTLRAVVATAPERVDAPAAADGPFAGVPTMLKDLFHGEVGWECGNGSRLAAGWRVGWADEFTRRIHAAGLVPMGRTATSEFGLLGTTETLAHGTTCTPWSTGHMAGGSSGGAGAVVGAGIVPVAAASDGGGSIRIPASACGVVGLKPSRGRVPWGPYVGEPLLAWATHFVMTRTVRDTAAALDALAGGMPGDPFTVPAPARPYRDEVGAPVERLRIAVWSRPWSGDEPDPEVSAATEATAALLAELGHDVEQARPQFNYEAFLRTMTDIWSATTAHTVDSFAQSLGLPVDAGTVEGPTLASVRYGRTISAHRLLDCMDEVNTVARAVGAFFTDHDLLLTPTLGALPAPLGQYDPLALTPPQETFGAWARHESFLPVFNATGHPAISLPLAMSADGLPIGMHLVARHGAEGLLLRLSAVLEEALPWVGRVPPVHASTVHLNTPA